MTIRKIIIIVGAVALGFVAAHFERQAQAGPAAVEPALLAEVNGVSIYAVNANGLRCMVTAPQGSVSCK